MSQATRDAFGEGLLEYADDKNFFVLGADLCGATKTQAFKEKYPDRFVDIGIAEANMIGVASGMAEYGDKIIMSSFASFITGRYDQIRCSLAMPNSNVVIAGTHSGVAIGKDGVTQMGTEDIALMSALPNMNIYNPSTYIMTKSVMEHIMNSRELSYLRLGRQPVNDYYGLYSTMITKLNNHIRHHDSNTCVINSGCLLDVSLGVSNNLNADLYDINYLDESDVLNAVDFTRYKDVIVIEDHSIIGGVSDFITRLCCNLDAKVFKVGLPKEFAQSGKPNDLYNYYGFNADAIVEKFNRRK
jgi:transketolase